MPSNNQGMTMADYNARKVLLKDMNGGYIIPYVDVAPKAVQDNQGQQIDSTYIKALSVSGRTVTYTKGDGTTGTITTQDTNTTYNVMTGATSSSKGTTGLVPASAAGDQNKYLRADGTWQTPPDTDTTYNVMTGASTSTAGTNGLVPAPGVGEATRYLRSDGTWAVPPDTNTTYSTMTAATSSAAGAGGLVPAPAAGDQAKFLRGDGAWATVSIPSYAAGAGISLTDNTFSNSGVRSVSAGTTNGTITVNTGGTSRQVSVYGLGSAAFTASTAYAASSHTHSYLPLSGGTLTGGLSGTTATFTGLVKGSSFQATSDRSLKSNITPYSVDLSKVSSYRYTLNSDGRVHIGLIAQEVAGVMPEAVSRDEQGFLALDYNAVVAALVNEVNALKQKVATLTE